MDREHEGAWWEHLGVAAERLLEPLVRFFIAATENTENHLEEWDAPPPECNS